ncbi:hypothetical protein N7528_008471 [Penicillium herquei]|nr:hypothetical protein N7528_008471 [Penicillium herquei]
MVLVANNSDDDSSDIEASDSSDSSDDTSPPAQRDHSRLDRLHSYINCLMDLSSVIERTYSCLQEERDTHSFSPNSFNLSEGARPFALLIQDRFPKASVSLLERLAEANLERSLRIRELMSQENQHEEPDNHQVQNEAGTLFKPFSVFHDSGIGTSIPTNSLAAPTIASHTSFLSTAAETASGRPRVPPLPQPPGKRFQCDYCRKFICMQNRIEWKIHVYADLQSYICTHAECRDAYRTFRTRRQWADHEFDAHQTQSQWCCSKCSTIESTQDLFKIHMETSHDIRLSGHLLAAAISQAEETALRLDFKRRKCDICSQSSWTTRKAYITHMGQHLEEISLACLPRDMEDSSDDGMDVDSCSSPKNPNEIEIEESHHRSSTYSLSERRPEQPAEPSPGPTIPTPATRAAPDPELESQLEVDASSQALQQQSHAFPAHTEEPNTMIQSSEQKKQEEVNETCASGQPLMRRASSPSNYGNLISAPNNKKLSSEYNHSQDKFFQRIEPIIPPDPDFLLEASESPHSREPEGKEAAMSNWLGADLAPKAFRIKAMQSLMRKMATENAEEIQRLNNTIGELRVEMNHLQDAQSNIGGGDDWSKSTIPPHINKPSINESHFRNKSSAENTTGNDHDEILHRIESTILDINSLWETFEDTPGHQGEGKKVEMPHDPGKALLHKDFYIEALRSQMKKLADEHAEKIQVLVNTAASLQLEIKNIREKRIYSWEDLYG